MSQQLKEFQVNGYTERSVQAFLDATNAEYQAVEDWTGAYTEAGMDVAGWGVTDISSKHLNRLADFMGHNEPRHLDRTLIYINVSPTQS